MEMIGENVGLWITTASRPPSRRSNWVKFIAILGLWPSFLQYFYLLIHYNPTSQNFSNSLGSVVSPYVVILTNLVNKFSVPCFSFLYIFSMIVVKILTEEIIKNGIIIILFKKNSNVINFFF